MLRGCADKVVSDSRALSLTRRMLTRKQLEKIEDSARVCNGRSSSRNQPRQNPWPPEVHVVVVVVAHSAEAISAGYSNLSGQSTHNDCPRLDDLSCFGSIEVVRIHTQLLRGTEMSRESRDLTEVARQASLRRMLR
jgi:hypothetical protein